MSLYYVQKLLYQLNRDPAEKQRFDEDRDTVLAQYTFTDEEIELIQDTMGANTFNFILADMSSGNHKVEVQAAITSSTSSQTGGASANASIGNGSVTVEEVRMIKGEDINL